MSTNISNTKKTAAIWERTLDLEGELSPAAARALLRLRFSAQDIERMNDLSAKAREGTLAPDEQLDIETFERLGCLLDILHSKARRVLTKAKRKK